MGDCATKRLLEATVDTAHVKHAIAQTVRIVPQGRSGLRRSVTCVFTHSTNRGYQRVIAFNSDSPHLPKSISVCV